MDFMSSRSESRDRSTEILFGDDQVVGVIGRNHEDGDARVCERHREGSQHAGFGKFNRAMHA